MDDFVLIFVFYPFSPWNGGIGSAAVREASWAWIVSKIHLLPYQYNVAIVFCTAGCLGAKLVYVYEGKPIGVIPA